MSDQQTSTSEAEGARDRSRETSGTWPVRPGPEAQEDTGCPGPRGAWTPVINHRRCEAKRACVAACPYDVLGVQRISRADWDEIGTIGRLRSRVHGRLTAYAVTPDACRGCGLCVEVCPEDAITVRAFPASD